MEARLTAYLLVASVTASLAVSESIGTNGSLSGHTMMNVRLADVEGQKEVFNINANQRSRHDIRPRQLVQVVGKSQSLNNWLMTYCFFSMAALLKSSVVAPAATDQHNKHILLITASKSFKTCMVT
jgi:hypothetical protein